MMVNARAFTGFVLAAGCAVLGTALLSQFWGGLAPCELCLLQRLPWDAAIAVSLVATVIGSRRVLPWVALGLSAIFALSVAFAVYHVGVEQHWFAGPSACTATTSGAMTLEEMKRQILGTAPVMCDQVQWSLFGVSLAGFNLLASFGMVAVCLAAFQQSRRAAPPLPSGAKIGRA